MLLREKTGLTAATVLLIMLKASSVNAETVNDQVNNNYAQLTNLETLNDEFLNGYSTVNYPKVSPRAVTMPEIAGFKNTRIFEVTPIDPAIVQWRHSDVDYGLQNPTQPGYQYTYEYITNYIYNVDDPAFINGFAISVSDFLKIKEAEIAAGATGYVHWTLSLQGLIEQGKVKMTDEIVCVPEKRDFTSSRGSTSLAGEHGWTKYINKTPLIDDDPMLVPEKAPGIDVPSSEAPSSEAPSSEAPSAGDEDDSNGTGDTGDEDDFNGTGDNDNSIHKIKNNSQKLPDTGENKKHSVVAAAILAAGLRVVSVIRKKNESN